MSGGGAPRQQSIPDQIAALADLLDRGAISPAEFEAKKAQLLDRL
jgi:putative oligomerization/nucleic acid binding protein